MSLYTGFSNKHYVYLVLATVFLSICIGEWAVRSFIVPIPNTTPYRINAIYTSNNKNVVVGDSHIFGAFISDDYFLNLAQGGTTIPMMATVVEQYFKNHDPGKIVIEASPQLFSDIYINRGFQNYDSYFTQNHTFPIKLYLFEPGIGGWIKKLKTPSGFSQLLEDKKQAALRKVRQGEWKNKNDRYKIEESNANIKRQQPNIAAAQEVINIYKEMISSLTSRGADVCLLRTPIAETYLKLIKDRSLFTKSIEIFRDISIEFSIPFIDFQDLNYDFTPDKFLDPDHITGKASYTFSKLVRDACFEK